MRDALNMPMNEAQTRKKYIDGALKRSGWNKIVPFEEGGALKDAVRSALKRAKELSKK